MKVTALVSGLTGLLGVLLVPLALSAATAWLLLIPAHLTFVALCCTGSVLDGYAGRPERARRWGFYGLLATAVVVGALEIGALLRGEALGYWSGPWLCALYGGWLPPVVGGIMGHAGVYRRARLTRRAVRRRRKASAEQR